MHLSIIFLLAFLLEFFRWKPHLNWKRFWTKFIWVVQLLNSCLCFFNLLVKNVSILVKSDIFTSNISYAFVKSHWNNFTSFWENFLNLFLTYVNWNEFDINVRVKGLCQVLGNRCYFTSGAELIILLAYMSANQKICVFSNCLLIHFFLSFLSIFRILEAYETVFF